MLKRFFTYLKVILVWVLVVGALVALSRASRAKKGQVKISEVNISIADSTENGNLASSEMVRRILQKEKISLVGKTLDKVDFEQIENVVSRNGFIERVDAYASLEGELSIDVWQRHATARLLAGGNNSYITDDAHIFAAPSTTAFYCPIITGDYSLCVPRGFVGSVDKYIEEQIEKIDIVIEKIEMEKLPIFKSNEGLEKEREELAKNIISPKPFENEDDYDNRVYILREQNRLIRKDINYRQRLNNEKIKSIAKRMDFERRKQKKLRKSCEDLHNLIIFVNWVKDSDFWSSEIVQIIADEGVDSSLRISLIMRSGAHKVIFGEVKSQDEEQRYEEDMAWNELYQVNEKNHEAYSTTTRRQRRHEIERVRNQRKWALERSFEERFEKLLTFYEEGLNRVGWDKYKEINIEFDKQVVCKK